MKNNNLKLKTLISFTLFILSFSVINAATNIDMQNAGEKWGWNDVVGWINMKDTDTVMVNTAKVSGYAASLVGDIMFDCATTRAGDTCAVVNFQTANDGGGNLSGWAWNDAIGWISMSGTTADAQTYQVFVMPSGDGINSYFRGWAWNDVVGWINFNCNDFERLPGGAGLGVCAATQNYKTQTSAYAAAESGTFTSSIFDIGTTNGIFNTITWKSAPGSGGSVQFQIATVANRVDLANPTYGQWFPVLPYPASPVLLTNSNVAGGVENRRYIRYRVSLISSGGLGPRIDDILINWSP